MRALLAKIDSLPLLKAILFLLALALFGGPAFLNAQRAAEAYAGRPASDWHATNVWLKSSDCAARTGAWLVICDGPTLRPINDGGYPDDPGHALLLDIYSAWTRHAANLVDVVRLNTFINAAGLVVLAAFLFACRAWLVLLVLLWRGPYEYVGWQTTLPHWGYIGATTLAAILPLAILAHERGWMPIKAARTFIVTGLLALGMAALIRESIGLMALIITAVILSTLWWSRRREHRPSAPLAALAILMVVAWLAPRWVTLARDLSFPVERASIVQSHGLSHTLYTTLVAVERNIQHHDDIGQNAVRAEAPDVVIYSPEYFRVLWRLYFRLILDDPGAALQAYLAKTRAMLGDSLLEPAPPRGARVRVPPRDTASPTCAVLASPAVCT